MKKKNIVILGSTGSIGRNTLRVAEKLSSRIQVCGLAVDRDYKQVLEQAERFSVGHVAVSDPEMARLCAETAPRNVKVHDGTAGIEELASLAGTDMVVCAVAGVAGLKPVLSAVNNGIDVALATKEVLVAAGRIVTESCAQHGAKLIPVDSEHSAIFQCLAARPGGTKDDESIKKIILTASGGPFTDRPEVNLNTVTVEEALRHPNWDMGRKITVDSATLMNKGLEIMEAHWLFNIPMEKINVIVHPESIVHSMVEFIDGSIIAQLGLPDMRMAIQYALTYPERVDGGLPALDIARVGALTFREPDEKRFPCLSLARTAAYRGGTMPAVLNAANEVAVQQFLAGIITFSGIYRLVEKVMAEHNVVDCPDLDEIIEADRWARQACETA